LQNNQFTDSIVLAKVHALNSVWIETLYKLLAVVFFTGKPLFLRLRFGIFTNFQLWSVYYGALRILRDDDVGGENHGGIIPLCLTVIKNACTAGLPYGYKQPVIRHFTTF